MENFTLQAVVTELETLLVGRRLGKVYQLGTTDLALDFHLADGRWLIISTDPQRLALYLTVRTVRQFEAEARADTPFTSLVKKHLSGTRLAAVDKLGYDRVLRFEFEGEDASGNAVKRALVIELTGRGANALLLDQGKVIATLRERREASEDYREPEPPAEKVDPFLCARERLDQLTISCGGEMAEAAKRYLIGFGPLYALELAARAERAGAFTALRNLLDELSAPMPKPTVYLSAPLDELKDEIGCADFALTWAPIELEHLRSHAVIHFATINEAADAYFTLMDERRRFLADRQRLNSFLAARLKKQRGLLANLKREREKFSQAETHQRYGELLLANLHQAVKTGRGFLVTDFYDEAQSQIEIPAADKPTAQETAEHYFKLARKARHGLQTINVRLPEIEREVAQLEDQLAQVAALTRRQPLDALSAQVGLPTAQPAAPSPRVAKKAKEERLSGMRRYRSSDGFEILVGRADRDNDALTFRLAKSFDLWFHAADYPGSHVVLRNPQRKQVPPRAITEAAQLAAKFSQARADSRVAVNYCERKFVTKLKGFAPGQVRISSFKTVLVEPREAGERVL